MKRRTKKAKQHKVGHTQKVACLKHKCTVAFDKHDAAKIKKLAAATGDSVSGLMRCAISKALINHGNSIV